MLLAFPIGVHVPKIVNTGFKLCMYLCVLTVDTISTNFKHTE